ncbi:hypothetical protein IWZ00DRAFT_259894 [Phyllosticta capitalensis]
MGGGCCRANALVCYSTHTARAVVTDTLRNRFVVYSCPCHLFSYLFIIFPLFLQVVANFSSASEQSIIPQDARLVVRWLYRVVHSAPPPFHQSISPSSHFLGTIFVSISLSISRPVLPSTYPCSFPVVSCGRSTSSSRKQKHFGHVCMGRLVRRLFTAAVPLLLELGRNIKWDFDCMHASLCVPSDLLPCFASFSARRHALALSVCSIVQANRLISKRASERARRIVSAVLIMHHHCHRLCLRCDHMRPRPFCS